MSRMLFIMAAVLSFFLAVLFAIDGSGGGALAFGFASGATSMLVTIMWDRL